MITNIDLFLITKNNESVITETLETYRDSVLRYFIYDNNSTDNTIEKIKLYFEKNMISDYHIISSSLNDIFNLIEKTSDYVLYVSPFERLIGNISINRRLTGPAYLVQYKPSNRYSNIPKIFSNSEMRKFILTANKYYKDAILADNNFHIITINNYLPHNDDYFKAEIHMLKNEFDKAEQIYNRILSESDNPQKRYACSLGLAIIKNNKSDDFNDIENTYIKTFNIDNTSQGNPRAEPLFILAKHYSKNRNFEKAYRYIYLIKDLKYPQTEAYGIIKSIYDYEILDELSIISYYIGKFKESIISTKKLLSSNLNNDQFNRVRMNSQFAINSIEKQDVMVWAPHQLNDNIITYINDLTDLYNIYLVSDITYDINSIRFKTKYVNDIITKKDFYAILLVNNFDLDITSDTFNILLSTDTSHNIIIDDLITVRLDDNYMNSYLENVAYVIDNVNPLDDKYYLVNNHYDIPNISVRSNMIIETTKLYGEYYNSLPLSGLFVKDMIISVLIKVRDRFGINSTICELFGDCFAKCDDFITAKDWYDKALDLATKVDTGLNLKIAKCLPKYNPGILIYDYLDATWEELDLEQIIQEIPNVPIIDKINIYVISNSAKKWVEFINNHINDDINFIRVKLANINVTDKDILNRFNGNSFNYRKDILSYIVTNKNIWRDHKIDQNICVMYEEVIINDIDKLLQIIPDRDIEYTLLSENIIHGYVVNPAYTEKLSFYNKIYDEKYICDILNVTGDPYQDVNIELFDNYIFYSGLDSNGYDIKYVGTLPISRLKELADEDDNCMGFNTFGWLKYNIRPVHNFSKLSDNMVDGLYVKNTDIIIQNRISDIMKKDNKCGSNLTFTITTCKRLNYFIKTMDRLLINCKDIDIIDDWICIDDNSSEEDRKVMIEKYPFFRFIMKGIGDKGHARSMNILFENINTDYVMHFEDDWKCERPFKISDILDYIKSDNEYGQIILRKICWADHIPLVKIDNDQMYRYIYNPTHMVKPPLNVDYDKNFKLDKNYGINKKYWWWPGFTLNPSIFNISKLRCIGNFREDIMQELFEYDYATRVYLNDISIAYINLNIEHIGKTSSYSLNNMKRYYDK